jgi:DNA mismatch repair protein MutS
MLTPLLEEYVKYQKSLEKKFKKNCVVLMMVGSFYEMYSFNLPNYKVGDLDKVSTILSFVKTRKDKTKDHSINNPYMCGFPTHSFSKNLSTLLRSNLTVAVYDQKDDENKKKKNHILQNIYSPSTYIDEETDRNTLMCIITDEYTCPIHKIKLRCGYISWIDLAVGKNEVVEFYDTKDNLSLVTDEINKLLVMIDPCEIITNTHITHNNCLIHQSTENKEYNNVHYQTQFLEKIFKRDGNLLHIFEYLNLDKTPNVINSYLHLLQFAFLHNEHIIDHIQIPTICDNKHTLYLNKDAFNELNIFQNNKYDLFSIINQTSTKMGMRCLKSRLMNPSTSANLLEKRYSFIDFFIHNKDLPNIIKTLKDISDIEKAYRKLRLFKLSPTNFANLYTSWKASLSILNLLKKPFDINQTLINDFQEFIALIDSTFILEVMSECDNYSTSFFKEGVNIDIDILNNKLVTISKMFRRIEGLFENDRARVKIITNDKEGYYIKTTKKAYNDIKDLNRCIKLDDFDCSLSCNIHEFTSTNFGSNYVKIKGHSLSTLEYEKKRVEEKIKELIEEEYKKWCFIITNKYSGTIRDVVKIIEEIDVSVSGAIVAMKYNYTRPTIVDKDNSFIEVKGLRHPIIERISDDEEYIKNNVNLSKDDKCILLFGLNSSGKSSLLRAIGCNIILSQIGMFVACDNFIINPFSRLMSKISTSDNLYKSQSTFIREMLELKTILQLADEKSLVLCDELTSGTEIKSSVGIVCSSLIELISKRCCVLFTTHLHIITDFPEISNNKLIRLFHFQVKYTEKETIQFDRVLKEGSGDDEYGIEIANHLSLPKSFIKGAFHFRRKFIGESDLILNNKKSRYNSKLFVDHCEMCGSRDNLHTHHKREQNEANEIGIIEHFHKNTKFNLMIVCETCHHSIHNSN